MAGKHSPNALRSYLEIHETVMERFRREGFVEIDALEVYPLGASNLKMEGQISCEGGLVCRVEKLLEVVDANNPNNPLVQTVRYAYNVHLAGGRNLFRYDNAHRHAGHGDENHCHAFDWRTGAALSVRWTGADWPTLGEVLSEMRDWYWQNRAALEALRQPERRR